ncbi:MAG: Crp/Fnr family transcriptional regulator, partial [Clostridia bacterium]
MNIININYTALLSQCFPFWEKISDDEKALLSRSTKLSKFSKGENIHSGNTNCTGVIILKTGCLRVYLLSDEGKEITLYRLYPNDVCVLSAFCVLKVITFDIFIDAEETSEA